MRGGGAEYDSLKAAKTGDRMVEFPLGYYYRPDPWTFIVSPDPIEGFQPSPACDLGNGTILNGFRLSEFDLCNVSSIPRSIPGQTPWVNITAQTLNNTLKARGQYLETFGAWCWINFLRAIKQQNLNSQKVNGMGLHSGKSIHTMSEDNIQGLDGYIGLADNNNVRTLGLQNFYGHVWEFLYNIMVSSDNKVWIKKDFININSLPTWSDAISSGWEGLDVVLPTTSSATPAWISELVWNSAEPWALYPSKLGGNDVEPIGDGCSNSYIDPLSEVIVNGSTWEGSSVVGTLAWHSSAKPSTAYGNVGGRSLEIIS